MIKSILPAILRFILSSSVKIPCAVSSRTKLLPIAVLNNIRLFKEML